MIQDFEPRKFIGFLEDLSKESKKDARKKMRRVLKSEGFKKYLFKPEKGTNLVEEVTQMYDMLSKPRSLKCIIETIKDDGYDEYDRAIAVLLNSLSGISMEVVAKKTNENNAQRNNGDISNAQYKDMNKKLEGYRKLVEEIDKVSQAIVEDKSRKLKKITNLPRKLCVMGLRHCPNTSLIEKYRIGYYLNHVLSNIYTFVDENPGKFDFSEKYNWAKYFKALFGEQSIADVATFILLEGVTKITKLNNAKVRICWDSLTSFALDTLETVPDNIRTQMTELYIKRIEKMLANREADLRVNLLELSEKDYPHMTKTISRYSDKIKAILKKDTLKDIQE